MIYLINLQGIRGREACQVLGGNSGNCRLKQHGDQINLLFVSLSLTISQLYVDDSCSEYVK